MIFLGSHRLKHCPLEWSRYLNTSPPIRGRTAKTTLSGSADQPTDAGRSADLRIHDSTPSRVQQVRTNYPYGFVAVCGQSTQY